MSDTTHRRRWPPLPLLPEFLAALLRQAMRPMRVGLRRTWLYRCLLKGKMPYRIVFYPFDALPKRLEDADALLRGRFRFAGEPVDITQGSVFDAPAPTPAWTEGLHGFSWLPPLAAAGGDAARKLASELMTQWVGRFARYSEPEWLPQVIARRLVHIFAHGRFVLSNSELTWRSRMMVSLREQSRQLARIVEEAPDGMPRFEAAAVLALSGACLDDSSRRLAAGLVRLERQIGRQILPDGGHITRSPEALLHAYRHVVMVKDALGAISHPVPKTIRSAHDRMAPMIRFFSHRDGALALFNGGREGNAKTIAELLARDDVSGQPFVHAPHSGYHRLSAGKALVLFDCGAAPPLRFSSQAHAGALAFELAAGTQRIVVNCGASDTGKWQDLLRGTAAHSTICVADMSMAAILGPGMPRDALGPRLMGGPVSVPSSRRETRSGWSVEASHDGYAALGIRHERVLTLAPAGNLLAGSDTLTPQTRTRKTQTAFTARFHIHPDVRCSLSHKGDVLLKLPSGDGWRFMTEFGPIALEDSVYVGGETVRRTEQIVLSGVIRNQPVTLSWVFERIS